MGAELEEYLSRREEMQPQDLLKFCFQSVLGPGHMAPERKTCALRIEKELSDFGGRGDAPEITLLEGEAARVDVDCRLSPESLGGLFCLSAEMWQERDKNKVEELMRTAENIPFPRCELEQVIREWNEIGRPAISHSEKYKLFYRAHYRVIMKRFLPFFDVIAACEKQKSPCVIGIDGMCGSGKSTLAQTLSCIFDAPVIHMDDFFMPFQMKTPERMAEPGGNVHYERFEKEVTPYLKKGADFSYGVYDCHQGSIRERRKIKASPMVIVEGSYSMNPHINADYDIKVFTEADRKTRLERIEKREGKEALPMFENRWMPLEDLYFESCRIKEGCGFRVRT